jgi:Flp pilus assembly protein TadG
MMKYIDRRKKRRGQAGIETVLVIIPMFMILLSIIDLSVAIFIMDTLEYAARQGVRYAITDNVATQDGTGTGPGNPAVTLNQDASIRQVVRDNSLGFLASAPDSEITINYYALNASNDWVSVTGANSNAGGNLVKVSVTGFSWAWMVPHFRGQTSLSMNAASADMMQGCPGGVCPTR